MIVWQDASLNTLKISHIYTNTSTFGALFIMLHSILARIDVGNKSIPT